jgi:4-hydroxy-tetrahydrodipicolinate reductase
MTTSEALPVGVSGARGKMGVETVKAIRARRDLALVFETGRGDDLDAAIRRTRARVVVDFTRPDCALENTLRILDAGARAVVGTTGFARADLDRVRARCEERDTGAVIAPNFAIGAILAMRFAEIAARHFVAAEIVELHHEAKRDAPSGTAVATAQRIGASRAATSAESAGGASRGERHAGIPIHSVRLPGLVAHQEVLFGGPGEVLTLRHDTLNREAYMPGVLLAIRRVLDVRGLVVGIEAFLE